MHFWTGNLFAALSLTAFSRAAILPRQSDVDQWLNAHNEVGATAQNWANRYTMEHSGGQYGENLAWGTGSFPISAAVKLWADESYGSLPELGCGVADCSGTTYYVCNYNPPGNVIGQFPENVEV
uniref:Pathogenesis-related protein 1 n=1 Tax=Moniliophthora roreri TaxID=221103 RepID=A0A0W0G5C0_MONRR|nr:pathogenesis-related protein 1 [Moniliophthora roreri]